MAIKKIIGSNIMKPALIAVEGREYEIF